MPRPEEGGWGDFTLLPKAERLPEPDRPHYCTCPDYPCTEATCLRLSFSDTKRCAACEKRGRALFTRAEERYVENGGGLPKDTIEALVRNHGSHGGHNSRLLRGSLPADVGSDPPEPVTDACA